MITVEKVSTYDNDVGYNSKIEGYTTFMSDINKLYAIIEEERLVVRREQYPSKESENTFAIIKVK